MNSFLVLLALSTISMCGCETRQTRPQTRREKENECYAQEKIYDENTDECYKLLTKGPCEKGHWFVLQKPKNISSDGQFKIAGVCAEEECNDGEYYWKQTRSCVKATDTPNFCGDGKNEELRYNLFGEGECMCTREPLRMRLYNDKTEPCHVLYSRGPCRIGEVMGFKNNQDDDPTCILDTCFFAARYQRRIPLSAGSLLAPWNGSCYELGTQGPCPEGFIFKVHVRYSRPACVSLTNSIFDLERECYSDENGNCQTVIQSSGSQFKREIFRAVRGNRRRRNSAGARKATKSREAIVWRE